MRWTSGLFVVIALAIACSTIVLPALGGETIRPRWPLPIGATRSMTRVVRMPRLGLEAQPLLRVERRQLAELRPGCGPSPGSTPLTVSRRTSALNFSLALALARLAHGAGDRVALAQAGLADLRQRDVDVVRAGQVARRPDERVVVEDVEDAGDRDEDVVLADLGLRPRRRRRDAVAAAAAAAVAVAVAAATAAAAAASSSSSSCVGRRLARWLLARPGGCPAAGRSGGRWSLCCRSLLAVALLAVAAARLLAVGRCCWRSPRWLSRSPCWRSPRSARSPVLVGCWSPRLAASSDCGRRGCGRRGRRGRLVGAARRSAGGVVGLLGSRRALCAPAAPGSAAGAAAAGARRSGSRSRRARLAARRRWPAARRRRRRPGVPGWPRSARPCASARCR